MSNVERAPGEEASLDVLRDQTRAWWMAVLAGQVDQSHPIHGTAIKAHLDGDTLVIAGKVPSEADRLEIEREIEHLRGRGLAHVRNELQVAKDTTEEKGLLVQTLVAAFETEEQAGFAAGYLEGHAHFRPESMQIISPSGPGDPSAAIRAALPEAFWRDAETSLGANHTLLIATVDEVDAFKARELLEEETRSLRTLVLPPTAASKGHPAPSAREAAAKATGGKSMTDRAARARERSLTQEDNVHGD